MRCDWYGYSMNVLKLCFVFVCVCCVRIVCLLCMSQRLLFVYEYYRLVSDKLFMRVIVASLSNVTTLLVWCCVRTVMPSLWNTYTWTRYEFCRISVRMFGVRNANCFESVCRCLDRFPVPLVLRVDIRWAVNLLRPSLHSLDCRQYQASFPQTVSIVNSEFYVDYVRPLNTSVHHFWSSYSVCSNDLKNAKKG